MELRVKTTLSGVTTGCDLKVFIPQIIGVIRFAGEGESLSLEREVYKTPFGQYRQDDLKDSYERDGKQYKLSDCRITIEQWKNALCIGGVNKHALIEVRNNEGTRVEIKLDPQTIGCSPATFLDIMTDWMKNPIGITLKEVEGVYDINSQNRLVFKPTDGEVSERTGGFKTLPILAQIRAHINLATGQEDVIDTSKEAPASKIAGRTTFSIVKGTKTSCRAFVIRTESKGRLSINQLFNARSAETATAGEYIP